MTSWYHCFTVTLVLSKKVLHLKRKKGEGYRFWNMDNERTKEKKVCVELVCVGYMIVIRLKTSILWRIQSRGPDHPFHLATSSGVSCGTIPGLILFSEDRSLKRILLHPTEGPPPLLSRPKTSYSKTLFFYNLPVRSVLLTSSLSRP